ncbi:cytochrome C oxidase subunit IV family protein [Taibaiella lutea]|uniref:Cytochrome C oxidase subunit IV family protein n=1 Tax=Taibaiella lutea TaxID=2608001 RepID=A0A5M6CPW8_9BACT|nr:cytochrome C oxidase subunit IV family protein [Taibaiella lutea]KAA5537348.1 cytochrome C oxidase subunit IV family protein [Taibaiella lutea]
MSAHHNSDDLLHYYEGDQSKLYSGILAHHSDEAGSKKQVRRIMMITLWLTIITTAEVLVGLYAHYNGNISKVALAFYFLGLTVFKAAMIVRVFMHLGDEKKNFVMAVIIPLSLFIWFIIAFISDGAFWLRMNNTQAHTKTEQVQKW